jgi:hypothetical protein
MSDLPQVIRRLASEPDFRAALLADPQPILTRQGFQVTAEELAALTNVAHLFTLSSQDLLTLFLTLAVGPEKDWFGRSCPESHAISTAG